MMSTWIQMELDKMINRCLMFIISWLIAATASVGGCFVHSTSVVASAGESVLLICTTYENGSITSWRIGKDNVEKNTIYTAAIYTRYGTITTAEKVAEGYFAIRHVDSETALYMNKTILSQAGLYVCTCDLRLTAETTVVILDSEPKFTTSRSVAAGDPVTFNCSVSFNASSAVSCELRIEDTSRSRVARRNESTLKNGLIACDLKYTIIANAFADQRYTCNVTISSNGDVIYSRVLNATVEWEPTSSTADVLSTTGMRAEAVIIIAVVVYFIISSKKRDTASIPQRSMGQPAEMQPSRCQRKPTNQYDKNRLGSPISVTSCPDAAHHEKQSMKDDELTVCENDLYGATRKQLDPSDGYFTEETIYHEI